MCIVGLGIAMGFPGAELASLRYIMRHLRQGWEQETFEHRIPRWNPAASARASDFFPSVSQDRDKVCVGALWMTTFEAVDMS